MRDIEFNLYYPILSRWVCFSVPNSPGDLSGNTDPATGSGVGYGGDGTNLGIPGTAPRDIFISKGGLGGQAQLDARTNPQLGIQSPVYNPYFKGNFLGTESNVIGALITPYGTFMPTGVNWVNGEYTYSSIKDSGGVGSGSGQDFQGGTLGDYISWEVGRQLGSGFPTSALNSIESLANIKASEISKGGKYGGGPSSSKGAAALIADRAALASIISQVPASLALLTEATAQAAKIGGGATAKSVLLGWGFTTAARSIGMTQEEVSKTMDILHQGESGKTVALSDQDAMTWAMNVKKTNEEYNLGHDKDSGYPVMETDIGRILQGAGYTVIEDNNTHQVIGVANTENVIDVWAMARDVAATNAAYNAKYSPEPKDPGKLPVDIGVILQSMGLQAVLNNDGRAIGALDSKGNIVVQVPFIRSTYDNETGRTLYLIDKSAIINFNQDKYDKGESIASNWIDWDTLVGAVTGGGGGGEQIDLPINIIKSKAEVLQKAYYSATYERRNRGDPDLVAKIKAYEKDPAKLFKESPKDYYDTSEAIDKINLADKAAEVIGHYTRGQTIDWINLVQAVENLNHARVDMRNYAIAVDAWNEQAAKGEAVGDPPVAPDFDAAKIFVGAVVKTIDDSGPIKRVTSKFYNEYISPNAYMDDQAAGWSLGDGVKTKFILDRDSGGFITQVTVQLFNKDDSPIKQYDRTYNAGSSKAEAIVDFINKNLYNSEKNPEGVVRAAPAQTVASVQPDTTQATTTSPGTRTIGVISPDGKTKTVYYDQPTTRRKVAVKITGNPNDDNPELLFSRVSETDDRNSSEVITDDIKKSKVAIIQVVNTQHSANDDQVSLASDLLRYLGNDSGLTYYLIDKTQHDGEALLFEHIYKDLGLGRVGDYANSPTVTLFFKDGKFVKSTGLQTFGELKYWVTEEQGIKSTTGESYTVSGVIPKLDVTTIEKKSYTIPIYDNGVGIYKPRSTTLGKKGMYPFGNVGELANVVVDPSLAQINTSKNSGRPYVVMLTADGCEACKQSAPKIADKAALYPDVDFYLISVPALNALGTSVKELQGYFIPQGGYPTFSVYQNDGLIENIGGYDTKIFKSLDVFQDTVRQLYDSQSSVGPSQVTPKYELNKTYDIDGYKVFSGSGMNDVRVTSPNGDIFDIISRDDKKIIAKDKNGKFGAIEDAPMVATVNAVLNKLYAGLSIDNQQVIDQQSVAQTASPSVDVINILPKMWYEGGTAQGPAIKADQYKADIQNVISWMRSTRDENVPTWLGIFASSPSIMGQGGLIRTTDKPFSTQLAQSEAVMPSWFDPKTDNINSSAFVPEMKGIIDSINYANKEVYGPDAVRQGKSPIGWISAFATGLKENNLDSLSKSLKSANIDKSILDIDAVMDDKSIPESVKQEIMSATSASMGVGRRQIVQSVLERNNIDISKFIRSSVDQLIEWTAKNIKPEKIIPFSSSAEPTSVYDSVGGSYFKAALTLADLMTFAVAPSVIASFLGKVGVGGLAGVKAGFGAVCVNGQCFIPVAQQGIPALIQAFPALRPLLEAGIPNNPNNNVDIKMPDGSTATVTGVVADIDTVDNTTGKLKASPANTTVVKQDTVDDKEYPSFEDYGGYIYGKRNSILRSDNISVKPSELLRMARSNSGLTIVQFGFETCGSCKYQLGEFNALLENEYGFNNPNLNYYYIDIYSDDFGKIKGELKGPGGVAFDFSSVPVTLVFRNGSLISNKVGGLSRDMIREQLTSNNVKQYTGQGSDGLVVPSTAQSIPPGTWLPDSTANTTVVKQDSTNPEIVSTNLYDIKYTTLQDAGVSDKLGIYKSGEHKLNVDAVGVAFTAKSRTATLKEVTIKYFIQKPDTKSPNGLIWVSDDNGNNWRVLTKSDFDYNLNKLTVNDDGIGQKICTSPTCNAHYTDVTTAVNTIKKVGWDKASTLATTVQAIVIPDVVVPSTAQIQQQTTTEKQASPLLKTVGTTPKNYVLSMINLSKLTKDIQGDNDYSKAVDAIITKNTIGGEVKYENAYKELVAARIPYYPNVIKTPLQVIQNKIIEVAPFVPKIQWTPKSAEEAARQIIIGIYDRANKNQLTSSDKMFQRLVKQYTGDVDHAINYYSVMNAWDKFQKAQTIAPSAPKASARAEYMTWGIKPKFPEYNVQKIAFDKMRKDIDEVKKVLGVATDNDLVDTVNKDRITVDKKLNIDQKLQDKILTQYQYELIDNMSKMLDSNPSDARAPKFSNYLGLATKMGVVADLIKKADVATLQRDIYEADEKKRLAILSEPAAKPFDTVSAAARVLRPLIDEAKLKVAQYRADNTQQIPTNTQYLLVQLEGRFTDDRPVKGIDPINYLGIYEQLKRQGINLDLRPKEQVVQEVTETPSGATPVVLPQPAKMWYEGGGAAGPMPAPSVMNMLFGVPTEAPKKVTTDDFIGKSEMWPTSDIVSADRFIGKSELRPTDQETYRFVMPESLKPPDLMWYEGGAQIGPMPEALYYRTPLNSDEFKKWKNDFYTRFQEASDVIYAGKDLDGEDVIISQETYDAFKPIQRELFDKNGIAAIQSIRREAEELIEKYNTGKDAEGNNTYDIPAMIADLNDQGDYYKNQLLLTALKLDNDIELLKPDIIPSLSKIFKMDNTEWGKYGVNDILEYYYLHVGDTDRQTVKGLIGLIDAYYKDDPSYKSHDLSRFTERDMWLDPQISQGMLLDYDLAQNLWLKSYGPFTGFRGWAENVTSTATQQMTRNLKLIPDKNLDMSMVIRTYDDGTPPLTLGDMLAGAWLIQANPLVAMIQWAGKDKNVPSNIDNFVNNYAEWVKSNPIIKFVEEGKAKQEKAWAGTGVSEDDNKIKLNKAGLSIDKTEKIAKEYSLLEQSGMHIGDALISYAGMVTGLYSFLLADLPKVGGKTLTSLMRGEDGKATKEVLALARDVVFFIPSFIGTQFGNVRTGRWGKLTGEIGGFATMGRYSPENIPRLAKAGISNIIPGISNKDMGFQGNLGHTNIDPAKMPHNLQIKLLNQAMDIFHLEAAKALGYSVRQYTDTLGQPRFVIENKNNLGTGAVSAMKNAIIDTFKVADEYGRTLNIGGRNDIVIVANNGIFEYRLGAEQRVGPLTLNHITNNPALLDQVINNGKVLIKGPGESWAGLFASAIRDMQFTMRNPQYPGPKGAYNLKIIYSPRDYYRLSPELYKALAENNYRRAAEIQQELNMKGLPEGIIPAYKGWRGRPENEMWLPDGMELFVVPKNMIPSYAHAVKGANTATTFMEVPHGVKGPSGQYKEGDLIPEYWVMTRKALEDKIQMPSVAERYQQKWLGVLTSMRKSLSPEWWPTIEWDPALYREGAGTRISAMKGTANVTSNFFDDIEITLPDGRQTIVSRYGEQMPKNWADKTFRARWLHRDVGSKEPVLVQYDMKPWVSVFLVDRKNGVMYMTRRRGEPYEDRVYSDWSYMLQQFPGDQLQRDGNTFANQARNIARKLANVEGDAITGLGPYTGKIRVCALPGSRTFVIELKDGEIPNVKPNNEYAIMDIKGWRTRDKTDVIEVSPAVYEQLKGISVSMPDLGIDMSRVKEFKGSRNFNIDPMLNTKDIEFAKRVKSGTQLSENDITTRGLLREDVRSLLEQTYAPTPITEPLVMSSVYSAPRGKGVIYLNPENIFNIDSLDKIQRAKDRKFLGDVLGGKTNAKITLIGDLHGVYNNLFRDLNRNGKMVDGKPNDINTWHWVGGDRVVGQLGDIRDRGPNAREIELAFNRLKDEAKAQGGDVVRVLGNHDLAYLRNERIHSIKYNNPDYIKAKNEILSDIQNGYVVPAASIYGMLLTHAGVSLNKFPEWKGKSADEIVADINNRFYNAINSPRRERALWKDPIFHISNAEKGKVPYKTYEEGGIFWMRPTETRNTTDTWLNANGANYTQVMGHTPDYSGVIQHLYTDANGVARVIMVDVGRNYWTTELPAKGEKGDPKRGDVLHMEINTGVPKTQVTKSVTPATPVATIPTTTTQPSSISVPTGRPPALRQEVEVIAQAYGLPKVWARKLIPILESIDIFTGIDTTSGLAYPLHIAISPNLSTPGRVRVITHELVHAANIIKTDTFYNILRRKLAADGLPNITNRLLKGSYEAYRRYGFSPLENMGWGKVTNDLNEMFTEAYSKRLRGESIENILKTDIPEEVWVTLSYPYSDISMQMKRLYGDKVAKVFDNAAREYLESLPYKADFPKLEELHYKLYGEYPKIKESSKESELFENSKNALTKDETVSDILDREFGRARSGKLPISLKREISKIKGVVEVEPRLIERSDRRPEIERFVGERAEDRRDSGERVSREIVRPEFRFEEVGTRRVERERVPIKRAETRRGDDRVDRTGRGDRVDRTETIRTEIELPRTPPFFRGGVITRIPPKEKPIIRFKKAQEKLGDDLGVIAWKQGFIYKLLYSPYGQEDILNTRRPVEGVEYKEGMRSAYDSIVRRGGYVPPIIDRDMGIYKVQISTMKDQRKPELRFRRDEADVYRGKKKKLVAKFPMMRIKRI